MLTRARQPAAGASPLVRDIIVVLPAGVESKPPGGQSRSDGGGASLLPAAAKAPAFAVHGTGRETTAMAAVEAIGLSVAGGRAEVTGNLRADADAPALVAALTRSAPTRGVAVSRAYDSGECRRPVEATAPR